MKKTNQLLFKPHYWKSAYTDARRSFQKTSLYKTCKKYPEATLYGVVSILGVIFLLTAKVFASAPILQEAGVNIPIVRRLEPIKKRFKVVEVVYAKEEAKTVATPVNIPDGCVPDNKYASFIYMKESGCDPSAVNPSGCRGLGQACPGDKLPCTADFACQHAWFTQYANDRYGGWEQAYNAWQNQGWW